MNNNDYPNDFSFATFFALYPLIVACLSVTAHQQSATASAIESCSTWRSRPTASAACQQRAYQLSAVMASTGLSHPAAAVAYQQRGYQLNAMTTRSGLSRPAAAIR
jgi:hypothetical protein